MSESATRLSLTKKIHQKWKRSPEDQKAVDDVNEFNRDVEAQLLNLDRIVNEVQQMLKSRVKSETLQNGHLAKKIECYTAHLENITQSKNALVQDLHEDAAFWEKKSDVDKARLARLITKLEKEHAEKTKSIDAFLNQGAIEIQKGDIMKTDHRGWDHKDEWFDFEYPFYNKMDESIECLIPRIL